MIVHPRVLLQPSFHRTSLPDEDPSPSPPSTLPLSFTPIIRPLIPLASIPLTPSSHPPLSTPTPTHPTPSPHRSTPRSRRAIHPKSSLDWQLVCDDTRCGMQFNTPEQYIDHRERVHFNNRDVRPAQQRREKAVKASGPSRGRRAKGEEKVGAKEEAKDAVKEEVDEDGDEGSVQEVVRVKEVRAREGRRSPSPVSPRLQRKRERGRAYYLKKKAEKQATMAGAALAQLGAGTAGTAGTVHIDGHDNRGSDSSDSSDSGGNDAASRGSSDSSGSSGSSGSDSSGSGSDSDSDSEGGSGSDSSESGDSGDSDSMDVDPFDRFGRADHSQSDSTSSDSDSNTSSSSLSSPPSTPPLPPFPSRRPPRRRPPSQPRPRPPPNPTPRTPRRPLSPTVQSAADIRARSIRNNGYLFKWRFPPSTPHHLLRCLLCQGGVSAELGLLLRCHGQCGLAMHAACMGMAWVPAGPWYCSETCDKGLGIVYGQMDELESIKVMRRWRQWWERRKKHRVSAAKNPQSALDTIDVGASEGTGPKAGGRGKKMTEENEQGVAPGVKGTRFFIRSSATVSSSSFRPLEQSRFAAEFPDRPPSTAVQVRRVFRPLSLTALDPSPAHANASAQSTTTSTSAPSITPTDQLPPLSTSLFTPRPAEPKARPRSRHLMFSLKQPRLDPTEHIVTTSHPARYPHAAKGPLPITSSRSLRGASTATTLSLRSASFLLSLRVPERDPGRAICCICEDGDSVEDNPIILCDGECRMAYHKWCIALKSMPREDEEWCCSELCKRAKARGVTLDDDVVVRLVQSRRDEYDERGPYDVKGGEDSAALMDLFAQLDGQYFCPRTMWRLWKKGKWRLQQTDPTSLIDIVQLIGGISEPGWDVLRVHSADDQPQHTQHPQPLSSDLPAALASATACEPGLEVRASSSQSMDEDSARDEAPLASLVSVPEPALCGEERSAQAEAVEVLANPSPRWSVRSQSWPSALLLHTATPSTPHPSQSNSGSPRSLHAVVPANSSASEPLLSTSPSHLARSSSTLPPTTDPDDSALLLLSEESRLLASYAAQVLANNQTKSKLLAAFHAHRIVNPSTLPTIAERQRQEEDVIRTYLEYEEKMGVGTEKDRTRRVERCHVNFCACAHCYNAHLRAPEGGGEDEEDRDIDLTVEDGEGGEEGHLDADDGGDDDVRVEEPAHSSSSFALPPALPPLTGSIDPEGVLRYVTASMKRREKALALAKIVGGPELTQLLEAGKAGRTLTRGQMKKQKEGDDEPPPPPAQPHHTRRRSAAQHSPEDRSASPTDSARRNQEIKSLSPWAWDRGWALRHGETGADPQARVAAVPRGHKRLRVLRDGEDVLLRPVAVRVRKARSRRSSGGSLMKRQWQEQETVVALIRADSDKERKRRAIARRGRESQRVRLLLEGDEMNVLPVDGQVRRRSRSGMANGGVSGMPSAIDATSAVVALAEGLVQQLQSQARPKASQLTAPEAAPMSGVPEREGAVDPFAFLPTAEAVSVSAKVQRAPRGRSRRADSKRSYRSTAEQRRAELARKRQRDRLRRDLKKAEQLTWLQQHERVVEVDTLVDGQGEVRLRVRVLIDYPWGRHKRKFDEIARLKNPYLIDAVLPCSSPALPAPPPTVEAEVEHPQAAPVQERGEEVQSGAGAGGRRCRSIRPRRSTAAESAQPPPLDAQQLQPQPLPQVNAEMPQSSVIDAISASSGAPLALVAEYPLDHNGLPIITNPIAEDICLKCGLAGDLILCDAVVDGIQCSRCWHVECLELSRPPSGTWACPSHLCTGCEAKGKRTRDKHTIHLPFTYCEWCDRSWCKACAAEVRAGGEVVEWAPKRPSDVASWVCCTECIRYFRDEYGKDMRDPHRQLLAHRERVVEQLKLQVNARGEQMGDDSQPQDDAEAVKRRRRHTKAKRARKRKQPTAAQRLRMAEQEEQAPQGDETDDELPTQWTGDGPLRPPSKASRAAGEAARQPKKRRRQQPSLLLPSHEPFVKLEEVEEERSFPDHRHSNGHADSSFALDTDGEESAGESPPPPPILLPCVTRSDLETTAVVRKVTDPLAPSADPFTFPQPENGRAWIVRSGDSSRSGRLSFKRNAVDTTASSAHSSNGVSPISLPSPSSPGSLQCLSTSSTLSSVSASSTSPPPSSTSPPPPSSLSLLAPPADLHVVVRRGEKRTRAASRVEFEGDSLLAKRLQMQLNQGSRTAYGKRAKGRR